MRNSFLLAVGTALTLTAGIVACQKNTVDPTSTNYSQNDADIQAYVTQNGLKGTLSNSGLYYVITKSNPTGKLAQVGDQVAFTYQFTNLKTGAIVDSTSTPFYSLLYPNFMINGVSEGLSYMREGESATLLIPSYLGYGNQDLPNLPAYSNGRFNLTLVRSRSEQQQIADYLAANGLTNVDSSSTGLRLIRTITNPTGAIPAAGQTLTVSYIARAYRSNLPPAKAFSSPAALDSSTVSGPFGQILTGGITNIPSTSGFREGLSKLKVGEEAILIYPSALGYSQNGYSLDNRSYAITPYSPLQVRVKLVSAK